MKTAHWMLRDPSAGPDPASGSGRVLALGGSVLASFTGWSATSVLLTWLAVHNTQSAMLVAGTLSARLLTFAVAGLPSGVLSDRLGHRFLLVWSNSLSAVVAVAFLAASSLDDALLPVRLIGFSALFGAFDAARTVATSNAAYEYGIRQSAIRMVAAVSLVAAVGQVFGGAIGGVVLDRSGLAAACLFAAICYLGGAVFAVSTGNTELGGAGEGGFRSNMRSGFALLAENASVRLLVAIAIAMEVLAFSSIAVEPLYARSVFTVGASGLGALAAARALGRLAGSLGLIAVGSSARAKQTLVAGIGGYGLALALLAASGNFGLALVAVLGTGFCGCIIDALEQFLLQSAVGPRGRGRAAGLWVFALGWGPIGYLQVGFFADAAGPRAGPAVNSFAVLGIAAALVAASIAHQLKAARPPGVSGHE